MTDLVATTFGLEDDALEARIGAIAINAYFAQLRALGRHEQPILDSDYRRIKWLRHILKAAKNVEVETPNSQMFAPIQEKVSKKFNQVEAGLEEALGLAVNSIPAEVVRQNSAMSAKKAAA